MFLIFGLIHVDQELSKEQPFYLFNFLNFIILQLTDKGIQVD